MTNTQSLLLAGVAVAVLGVTLGITSHAMAADADKPQYYELRVYSTKSEKQQKLVSDYWQNAAVPAYNRMGIQPIGVFTEVKDSPTNKIYVLIPYESLDVFASVPAKLAADGTYQSAAAEYLNASKFDPAFDRIESSLHVAFEGMKKLALPPSSAEKKPWIFELRTYLSPSEGKGDNKVKMFNSGEITLMQEVGMCPVFFAQTVAGPHMPNLVYMVSGEDADEHKKHWQGFINSPVWKKLSSDPYYKDNMTDKGIINVFLKRTPASQI
jgi:NIPSNAP